MKLLNDIKTQDFMFYDGLGREVVSATNGIGNGGSMETQTNTYTYTNKVAISEYVIRPISGKTLTYSIRNEYSATNDALLGVSYQAKADTSAIKDWTLRYLYDKHGRLSMAYRPKDLTNLRGDYKYNGKELDMMSGLNTYDYGGRQYYPSMPMWDRVDPLCEDNYHSSPYAYCLDRPTMLIDFDGYKPTEEEAARIAGHVYGNGDVMLIGGWRVSKRKFENVNYIDDESGFKSKLYERTIDGKTEYVYATAGTDFTEWKDWKNNVQQLVGKSKQYETSMDNAWKLYALKRT